MKVRARRELVAWAFLLPHFCLFLMFIVIPLILSFIMALHDWRLLGTPLFLGLENFNDIKPGDQLEIYILQSQ